MSKLRESGFNYLPIRQRTQLRLLSIHAGDFNQPVQCDIFTRNVADADYEAISYTWSDESGDKSKCKSIILDSAPFSVTRNCEMALKRVRKRLSRRCIWIDAVCINQKNLDERGHQVQLMPQIYSRAKVVLIYIGESANNSSSILQTISNGHGTDLDLPTARDALDHLLSRKYFSRVWVLQELALARKSDLICGDVMIPWRSLEPGHLYSLQLMKNPETLLNSTKIPSALQFSSCLCSQPDQFLDLLDFASNCFAENARDKVYSLLGLVLGSQSQGLVADYTLTVEEVYIKTAICLGRHFGWGPVFEQALARNSQVANLPSWVPDWSTGRYKASKSPSIGSDRPLPKPIEVCETSRSIIFRVLSVSGVRKFGLSVECNDIGLWHAPFNTPMVHHLFNFEDISSDVAQPCICFLTDSPLFSFLQGKVQGWKHLTTKPFTGIYERITSQHPAYEKRSRGIRLYGADWDGESHSWSYMPKRDFKDLRLSYDGLIQMLDILRTDFPLNLPLNPTAEAWSLGEWPPIPYWKKHVITEDNFDDIVAHLGTLSVAQGQPPSVGGWDFNKRSSRMAFELLVENYVLRKYEICIV